MTRIFISYSRVDDTITKEFAELLNHSFDHVWYDTAKLVGGDDWWQKILAEIESCDHFIYLLSKDSLESNYCQQEFEEARHHQKHIIPVCVRAKTTIPDEIKKLQVVDMFAKVTVDGLNRIYGSIIRHFSTKQLQLQKQNERDGADLKLLRRLWPLIKSHYWKKLIDLEVEEEKIDVQTYGEHISRYLHLRSLGENKFFDQSLESAFTNFDHPLKNFAGIISYDWRTRLWGTKRYLESPHSLLHITAESYQSADTRQEYHEALESKSKLNKVLPKIKDQHSKIIEAVRNKFPDFFVTDEQP